MEVAGASAALGIDTLFYTGGETSVNRASFDADAVAEFHDITAGIRESPRARSIAKSRDFKVLLHALCGQRFRKWTQNRF
jgi:hypothetical protein